MIPSVAIPGWWFAEPPKPSGDGRPFALSPPSYYTQPYPMRRADLAAAALRAKLEVKEAKETT